jgi:hypothetical protein
LLPRSSQGQYFLPGTLQAMNTLEGFKEFDRSAALQQVRYPPFPLSRQYNLKMVKP